MHEVLRQLHSISTVNRISEDHHEKFERPPVVPALLWNPATLEPSSCPIFNGLRVQIVVQGIHGEVSWKCIFQLP
jgi:hypothetical protein